MIFGFLRHTAWILRWKTSISKSTLLLTYIRISLKYALLVRLLGRSLTKDRIFGYTISFFDYEAFKLLFEEVFISEEYHFQAITPSPRIIDCGGNIGFAVLYFKMLYPEARITSFEASPQTFELLEQNVRNNGFTNVELLNRAVWDHEGEIPFYSDPERPGDLGASTRSRHEEITEESQRRRDGLKEGAINVPCVRLSTYLNEPVDFVKMDIEGSEDEVIREVAQSGKLPMINELVMEYHHHIRPDCDQFAGLLHAFETNGFGYQITTFSRLVKRSYQSVLLYTYRK